jgi:hypothetical protein
MRPEYEALGTTLSFRCSGELRGEWDRYRLEQVVTNLLTNGIKYGAREPVEITLDASERQARLYVKDQGIGIAPEHHERVFRQFERVVADREISGLGLGLWFQNSSTGFPALEAAVPRVPGNACVPSGTAPGSSVLATLSGRNAPLMPRGSVRTRCSPAQSPAKFGRPLGRRKPKTRCTLPNPRLGRVHAGTGSLSRRACPQVCCDGF